MLGCEPEKVFTKICTRQQQPSVDNGKKVEALVDIKQENKLVIYEHHFPSQILPSVIKKYITKTFTMFNGRKAKRRSTLRNSISVKNNKHYRLEILYRFQ